VATRGEEKGNHRDTEAQRERGLKSRASGHSFTLGG
jgi:hypothetical protein